MSSYSQKTRIVFLDLPTEIQKKVDQLRKLYNPSGVKRGVAHITFKQDEDYLIDNPKFIEIVESQEISPFKLIMDGIKIHSENGHYVIFVSFKKNPSLNKAISSLSKELEPYVDKESPDALASTHWEQSDAFFPHITITSGKDEDNIGQKLYEQIISRGFNLKEEILCNSLRICEWDNDYWKRIHHIDL